MNFHKLKENDSVHSPFFHILTWCFRGVTKLRTAENSVKRLNYTDNYFTNL